MMSTFAHEYAELGAAYSASQLPTPVRNPGWLAFNHVLADTLGWPEPWRQSDAALAALSGNTTLETSQPVATVYAGHQFGSYNPRLGDGRAILLGEWRTPDGKLLDIQLKGAGPTPYSRGGDGRSPVGPVVREYLVSEAMQALGVPTTRALAATTTGELVYREAPEPGAVLTRVASSHLRIGTIQYFAMTERGEGLEELIDYVVRRHYQAEVTANPDKPAAEVLLRHYGPRLASLIAKWQTLGFVHGVMNTDNMLLSGETVDYGPCAFMDHFDPQALFSSIDTGGRYAWPNQPHIGHWNLSVLAQCLLPLLHTDQDQGLAVAQQIVDEFPQHYLAAYRRELAQKFGLEQITEANQPLVDRFFEVLAEHRLDLTLAFRWLTEIANDNLDNTPLSDIFSAPADLEAWLSDWRAARTGDTQAHNGLMTAHNPCVIPRNHQVAAAIAHAEAGSSATLDRLFDRWCNPHDWEPGDTELAKPPEPQERVLRTFCGT